MVASAWEAELAALLADWQVDPIEAKAAFVKFRDILAKTKDVELSFKARPGVSYSLRAKHVAQKERELFVMVDVVDDDPEERWLSVCFYADYVKDKEELGDVVPAGLNGEDACCFNLDENNSDLVKYIAARLKEAAKAAAKG